MNLLAIKFQNLDFDIKSLSSLSNFYESVEISSLVNEYCGNFSCTFRSHKTPSFDLVTHNGLLEVLRCPIDSYSYVRWEYQRDYCIKTVFKLPSRTCLDMRKYKRLNRI